ncbi:MAG: hypothetical protein PHG91_00075 [Syntrophales bacterium]|nr:hypothetical protein [Syntrophales bacterium]MDD5231764.1 hypothetical protein [Syntrophales bacterium]MDD5531962.1 hypothetical protein [Syntrophales bacterium]HPL63861.1 hypothetical protein [Syntrophales bacterium]
MPFKKVVEALSISRIGSPYGHRSSHSPLSVQSFVLSIARRANSTDTAGDIRDATTL